MDREQLILNNVPLVASIAGRYFSNGAESQDLVQSGCVGLIQAVDSFDENGDIAFASYAYRHIKSAVYKTVLKTNWPVSRLGDNDIDIPDNCGVGNEDLIDILATLVPLKAWIIRRLFGVPEPFGARPHVLTLVGKRRSLPVHQKEPWSVSEISRQTGLTTKRVLEIKKEILVYLSERL